MEDTKKQTFFWIIILAAVGFGVYINSLGGALFWDDEITVINNVFIRHPVKYLGEIFTGSYHSGAGETLNFYRPLATLSFALDYAIWNLKPFGYHLSNVILHAVNGILIFLLLRKIFADSALSFFSACLFLVHPINSETVNYVSNRTDLLMLLFFLAAFYLYILYRKRGKTVFLLTSMVMYSFSILSKEMGLVLPFFLLAYDIVFAPPDASKNHKGQPKSLTVFSRKGKTFPLLGFIIILAGYIVLRATLFNFLEVNLLTEGAQAEPYSQNIIFRLLIFAKVFLAYLKLFFWPVNLHMEYDPPYLEACWGFIGWITLIFLLLSAMGLFYFGRKEKTITFGGSWFILGLLPVSGIVTPINNIVSEHYLYLSSAGFFILITALVLNLRQNLSPALKMATTALCVIILANLCRLTFLRNTDWNNPLKMYLDIAHKTEYSFRANNNAGVEYFRGGDSEEAERYFRRSLNILPTYSEALNNLGVIFERKGRLHEAESYYKKSIASKSDYLLAHKNLAQIYLRTGRIKEAKDEIDTILKIYPYDSESQILSRKLNSLR